MAGLSRFFSIDAWRSKKVPKVPRLSPEERENRREKELVIRNYPVKRMTRKEFEELASQNTDGDFLETCPLGTWIVCEKSGLAPEVTVVGQVMGANKLLDSQYGGAMLSLPRRGLNRYRLQLVEG